MNFRKSEEKFFKVCTYTSAFVVILVLFIILGSIAYQGIPAINLQYLTTQEARHYDVNGRPQLGGAIANAIAGTFLLSIFSVIFATPISVGTALYLQRYAKKSYFTKSLTFLIEVLSGTPSIVLGVVGFFILVILLKYITGGYSLISGSVALAVLILPTIERAAEEAIKTVPRELEEASYALGATKWQTLKMTTLPYAMTGIITGIVLGVGRAAEESAVVVFTAGYSQYIPEFKVVPRDGFLFGLKFYPFQDFVGTLPIAVYHSYEFPTQFPPEEGFAAAFILILIVMFINCLTKLILWKRNTWDFNSKTYMKSLNAIRKEMGDLINGIFRDRNG